MYNRIKYVFLDYIKGFFRIKSLLIYGLSLFIGCFTRVHPKRILLWSAEGKNYACNPRALTEYLLKHPELGFDVYYAFRKGRVSSNCKAKTVILGSLKYLYVLNTSEFVLTNHRIMFPRWKYWRKRNGQKYIMTWHGSTPLKMIEKDAIGVLGKEYEKGAIYDSGICDLIISDNKWFSETIRRAFWYKGEILESGLPRNDDFFDKERQNVIYEKVRISLKIPQDNYIILYAPTFRENDSTDSYVIRWDECLDAFEQKTGKSVVLLTRLHPNLIGRTNFSISLERHRVIDTTLYDNMQELLIASDTLITDFSGTMFEISMLMKPCFLVASDIHSYERNTYISIDDLPFKKYDNIKNLVDDLPAMDMNQYVINQKIFIDDYFAPIYNGNASKRLVNWMISKSIS